MVAETQITRMVAITHSPDTKAATLTEVATYPSMMCPSNPRPPMLGIAQTVQTPTHNPTNPYKFSPKLRTKFVSFRFKLKLAKSTVVAQPISRAHSNTETLLLEFTRDHVER